MNTCPLLLIDAGATKTEFVVLEQGLDICHDIEDGINPNYCNDLKINEIFELFRKKFINSNKIGQIFYYGAGCASKQNQQRISDLLAATFSATEIHVYSDLMATCHALCHQQPAIVAILGTGSSSCHYDGKEVVERAPSLGYLLGDEGSGTDLGKRFLKCYLNKQLPNDLTKIFEQEYHLTPETAIKNIYNTENKPNTFFASLAPFVGMHKNHPYIHPLCLDAFSDFFATQQMYYTDFKQLPWQISGSVGYHFKDIVTEAAEKRHCIIGNIVAAPMNGLVNYYKVLSSCKK